MSKNTVQLALGLTRATIGKPISGGLRRGESPMKTRTLKGVQGEVVGKESTNTRTEGVVWAGRRLLNPDWMLVYIR